MGELRPKAAVGVDILPPLPNELQGLLKGKLHLFHEESDGEAGAAGNPGRAVDENLPVLSQHPLHPFVVILEELGDVLLGKVRDLIDFVRIARVPDEGSLELGPARADRGYLSLLQQLLGPRRVFVAQVDAVGDSIDFGVQSGALGLVEGGLLHLRIVARPTNPVLIVVLEQFLIAAAQEAGHLLLHAQRLSKI